MFRYASSLSQRSNVTRLLRLLPSQANTGTIQCELFEYTLQEADTVNHPYEALSYVWGGDEKPESITIVNDSNGDEEFAVTRNLHTALRYLRDRQIPRIIWVDAVCINQSDKAEKAGQIPLMAAIYAKASRVIVWLGEAHDDGHLALEAIRVAAENSTSSMWILEAENKAIQQLSKRPWFRRIWVLQEVAAARHVNIMCGHTEIDGHTFCLGLESLNMVSEYYMNQAAFLIRGAIFRPRRVSRNQGRLSLSICSLGQLVDMYHTFEAKILHDKVFALLGMSSDDLSKANLESDYNISWSTLMRNLVKFLIGDNAFVRTWDGREIALIQSKGYILGRVFSITPGQDDKQQTEITFASKRYSEISWTLPSSTNSVKKGDVVCFLQGAQRPTVIRLCKDYFIIIQISVLPLEHMGHTEFYYSDESFHRDFLLVWDWQYSETILDPDKHSILVQTNAWQSENADRRIEEPMNGAIIAWNNAQILGDQRLSEEAKEMERQAAEIFTLAVKQEHTHSPECQCNLVPLIWAAHHGYDAVVRRLLRKDSVNLNSKDCDGQTPLLLAACNGHEAVVKQLLKARANIKSKDLRGHTPLLLAAANRHEAVIKQLLKAGADTESMNNHGETLLSLAVCDGLEAVVKQLLEAGANIESKDRYGKTPLSLAVFYGRKAVIEQLLEAGANTELKDRTPLLLAASNGREAVVKQLLEAGANIELKDGMSRTPLSLAASNGHEAVVKLLLEAGAETESKDLYDQTPLSLATSKGHIAVIKQLLEAADAKRDALWG